MIQALRTSSKILANAASSFSDFFCAVDDRFAQYLALPEHSCQGRMLVMICGSTAR